MYQNEEEVTLYIGESYTTHGLKRRVTQNFTALDTGGTFKNNLALLKFDGDMNESVDFIKKYAFVQFIIVEDKYKEFQIKMLEQVAISLFEPLYNKKVVHFKNSIRDEIILFLKGDLFIFGGDRFIVDKR